MDKSDFNYYLPKELIAQTPIDRREFSRLLCLNRDTGEVVHNHFFRLPQLLREGDCLVLNDSRVMPARLLGRRMGTGGAVEVLLLREMPDLGDNVWECLTRPGAKTKTGAELVFGEGELAATVTGETEGGNRLVRFEHMERYPPHADSELSAAGTVSPAVLSTRDTIEKLGKMPLPPYIRGELVDAGRYQTVYSRVTGSAAAPTAGLHFTNELLHEIAGKGVGICFVTLHVGLGTFRPVKTDAIEEHKMHSEYFIIPDETARMVNSTKTRGGRVIAVGTTSCRALEAVALANSNSQAAVHNGRGGSERGGVSPFSGFTDIFIYPGYEFMCVDGLVTNFHLPESTLIMLVSAFAGRENVLRAYGEAVREQYRFFSFGDAMLII